MSNLQKHGRLTALAALLGASRLDKHTPEEREAYECLEHIEYIQHQPNESDFSSAVGRILSLFPIEYSVVWAKHGYRIALNHSQIW